jgi:hypothetical protein
MTENKKILSTSFRLSAFTALTLTPLLASSPSFAADDYFRSYAPSAPFATPGLPKPIIGDETRIPAARPAAAGPAYANYGAPDPAPQGRLRLRPMNFGGM